MRRTRWSPLLVIVAAVSLLATACPAEEEEVAPENGEVERPDDELRLGYLLPETGELAFLGPAQIRAIEMAIDEIEEAGGPLGLPIELFSGDEADDEALASEAADSLLGEGVHAIVGAAASGMSLAVIDQITGEGVVQCSASNTSPTFTDYPDDDYYFRTAPSDVLQGPVLSEVVLEDGHERIAMLGRGDDYGRGLVEATRESLEEAGADIVLEEIYDPEAVTFDAEASAVGAEDPDAVVMIPFEEGVRLIQDLIEVGISPDQMYGADGIRDEELNESVDPENPNVVDGFKGTGPDPEAVPGFLDRLREFDPELEVTIFAPQAYDCVMLIALGTVAAGTPDPAAVREEIIELSRGDNDCEGFEECAELLEDGETINYQFASGVMELTDEGEPLNGQYEVWEWADGELTAIDSREIMLEE